MSVVIPRSRDGMPPSAMRSSANGVPTTLSVPSHSVAMPIGNGNGNADASGYRSQYLSTAAEVDLSNRGATTFPDPQLIPNCTSLNLSNNSLQRFSPSYHSSRLLSLNVARNKIVTAINVDAFRFLEVLDLSDNLLDNVEPLRGLERLIQLDVSRNRLTSLDALSGLPVLQELRAASNRVQALPDLSRCGRLLALGLSQNRITNAEQVHRLLPPQVSPCLFAVQN